MNRLTFYSRKNSGTPFCMDFTIIQIIQHSILLYNIPVYGLNVGIFGQVSTKEYRLT